VWNGHSESLIASLKTNCVNKNEPVVPRTLRKLARPILDDNSGKGSVAWGL